MAHWSGTASVSTLGCFCPLPPSRPRAFSLLTLSIWLLFLIIFMTLHNSISCFSHWITQTSNSSEAIFIKYSHYTAKVSSFYIGSIYFLLPSHPLCPDTSPSGRRRKRAATASEMTWKNSLLDAFPVLALTSSRCSCYPLKSKTAGQQVHTVSLRLFSSASEGRSSSQWIMLQCCIFTATLTCDSYFLKNLTLAE